MKDKDKQLDELLNQGLSLYYGERHEEAARVFLKALEIDSNNAEIQYNLGSALYYQNKTGESLGYFKKAVELSPDDPHFRFVLGNTCMELDNIKDAIDEFIKSIEIDNINAHVHKNLGEAYYLIGEYGKSAEVFKTALDMDPNMPEVSIKLHISLRMDNREDEAMEALQKAQKNVSRDNVLFDFIKLYLGYIDEKDLEIKTANRTNNCTLYYHAGTNMIFEENLDEALDYFEKCVDSNLTYIPEYRRAQYELKKLKTG